MKRALVVLSGVAVLGLLLVAACAVAEEKAEAAAAGCPCGHCRIARGVEAGGEQEKDAVEMVTQRGLPAAMATRCALMMSVQVSPEDPAALLALRKQLDLTADQAKQLEAIAKKARTDAAAVLTAEQKAKLQPLAATPDTMAELHGKLTPMMFPGMRQRPAEEPGEFPRVMRKPGERPEGVEKEGE